MNQYISDLKNLKKDKKLLICIDSDGCAIDTMEIKHKQCFGPKMVKVLGLEEISEEVLQVWNYVNLYSKWRGINRFKGLIKTLELLEVNPTVIKSNINIPQLKGVEKWINETYSLSMPLLTKEIMLNEDQDLIMAYNWSKEVNESIDKLGNVSKLFPNVLSSIQKMSQHADIVVVSSANHEALVREWHHLGIDRYVRLIGGQEYGTKSSCIYNVMRGRYSANKTLMIGDSPGDMKAAKKNKIAFYPILPKEEGESWQRFELEIMSLFVEDQYRGSIEEEMIETYNQLLG